MTNLLIDHAYHTIIYGFLVAGAQTLSFRYYAEFTCAGPACSIDNYLTSVHTVDKQAREVVYIRLHNTYLKSLANIAKK